MITLTVTLQVMPGHLDNFLTAIEENALRSFTDESGCVYFDVCQNLDDEMRFTFFEVYADQEAMSAHRSAPHFTVWRQAADQFVVPGSQVNVLSNRLIHHAPDGEHQ